MIGQSRRTTIRHIKLPRSDEGTDLEPHLHTGPKLQETSTRQSSLASRFLACDVKELREDAALQNCKNTTGTTSTKQNPLYYYYQKTFNSMIKEV